jgi:signal transduction histidine kinase
LKGDKIHLSLTKFPAMRKSYVLFTVIFPGLIFFGCQKKQITSDKEKSNDQRTLLDSIKKLDSLSFEIRLTNRTQAQQYADVALKLASTVTDPEGLIIAYSGKAKSFPFASDSQFIYLTKAMDLTEQSKNFTHKPNLLSSLGMLYNAAHNPEKAVLLLDSCIRLAGELHNYLIKSMAYNELGTIHGDAKDHKAAKSCYDSAYRIALEHGLFRESGFALGNLAKLEKSSLEQRRLGQEAAFYLQQYQSSRDGLAGVLINIGSTFSDPDSAIYYYTKALDISVTGNLPSIEIMVYNNLVYAYLDKRMIREARSCLTDHAIPLAEKIKDPDLQSTLYDTFSDVLSAEGNFKEAVLYEKKSIAAGAEAAKQAAAGQVRLLSAMLDLKNKESAIHLRDQEISVHRNNERIFRMWLGISLLSVLLLLVVLFITRLRNKLKSERERLESSRTIMGIEENEKRKLSMDLHDLSGQVKIELLEQFNRINIPEGNERSEMTGTIKSVANQIRTMSHRMSRITIDQFDLGTLINGLCSEFREFSGLDIDLTRQDDMHGVDDETKLHIFRMLQEILSNASKYTKGAHIKIEISVIDGNIVIVYSDNGPGFETGGTHKEGLGLINIRERAKILGGKAALESATGLGVFWEITIPLIKK